MISTTKGFDQYTNDSSFVVLLLASRKQAGFRGSIRADAITDIARVLPARHAQLLKLYLFSIRDAHEVICANLVATIQEKQIVHQSFQFDL